MREATGAILDEVTEDAEVVEEKKELHPIAEFLRSEEAREVIHKVLKKLNKIVVEQEVLPSEVDLIEALESEIDDGTYYLQEVIALVLQADKCRQEANKECLFNLQKTALEKAGFVYQDGTPINKEKKIESSN